MEIKQGNYRGVFKATAILGGVQLFNIVVSIIRNKIVSMLLGPAGMGIVGLLGSASSTVTAFTGLGVSFSAIKNIASAYEKGDLTTLGKVIYVVKHLLWFSGLLGAIVCMLMSRQLSLWSFGNEDFTISFIWVSISLFLVQLTNNNILQIKGCRQIKWYAKANVLGNFLSLFITIPLYYLYGVQAIAPVMVLLSVSTFLCSVFYQKKLGIKEIKASSAETYEISKDVLYAGIAFASAELFPILASYYIRIFISDRGGLADVGLYSAGFAILNGYVGMIFTAMSTDYFPRLSAISDDDAQCTEAINQQIELSSLILFPLLVLFVIFGRLIVYILYAPEFLPVTEMIYWGGLGMLAKVPNWCFGGVLIPKRENKAYFVFSLVSATLYLIFNMWFYSLWGVMGLGVSFLCSQVCDAVISYFYIIRRYEIDYYHRIFIELVSFIAVIMAVIALNSIECSLYIVWSVEAIIAVLAVLYSYKRLNKLMDLSSFIKQKLHGKK